MAKALVTGASGFIGSRLVRQLVERGDDVRVLVRPTASTAHLKGLPVDVAVGDITIGHTIYRALSNVDRVYHVAAVYKMWDTDPAKIMEPAIRGTREVLEAIKARGSQIKKIVVTSSVAAIGCNPEPQPMDESFEWKLDDSEQYIVAKRRAEEVALSMTNELPIVVVNPSGVFGPGDAKPTPSGHLIVRYLNWKMPIAFPGGPGGMSIVDVDDVAQGHILAMDKGRIGERYILGGDNLTITQIVETLSSITGLRGPGKPASKGLVELVGRAMELGARAFGGEPEITYKLTRDFYDRYMYVSSAKAEKELGYKHRPARKTLARAIRWYLDKGYVDPKIASEIRYDDLPGPDPLPTLPHERNAVFKEG
jgi:dihydroflavonol-4-reductase